MTEYERGRAAGLAEAVKVATEAAGNWQTERDTSQPRSNAYVEHQRAMKACIDLAWAINALSPSPDHVLVPRDKTLAAEWLKQHWNTFCDCDAIPVGRDRFIKELEDAGLVELREVIDEDLDEAFAFERGIEKGGMIWVLTEAGRAMIAQVK